MVGQQRKIPGDAVVKLLLAEGGLQVNFRVVFVLFHVAQMAGRAEGQRAADAKMGKQHLALLVEDGFVVFVQGQRYVFQGQTHHLFAVRVVADEADEAGHRVHDGVARLLGQLVAVARGARGGVAQAARGHQHCVGLVLQARGAPDAHAAVGRARLFLFGVARVFGGFWLFLFLWDYGLQQQLFCAVFDDLRVRGVPQQRLPDLLGLIGHREHPAAPLHFQLHTQALEELHGFGGRERPQRGVQEPGIRPHMVQKLLGGAIVGHVTAALARDENLLAGLFGVFQHRDAVALPRGCTCRHEARRAAADDDDLCHPSTSFCKNSIISIVSYQNRRAKAIGSQKHPSGFFRRGVYTQIKSCSKQ